MPATEDGVSGLMAEYLRSQNVSAVTQISIPTPGTRYQPDFQVENGGVFLGEAKWESGKWEGFGEARDYGQNTGVNGAFLIAYPEALQEEATQARLGEGGAEAILSDHTYSCAFLRRDEGTDMQRLPLKEIPRWLKSHMEERELPEPDPDEVVSVFRQTANRLNTKLETAPDENLFRNVLGASPDDEDLQRAARQTAGFLLVNQLTFYRVLSSTGRVPEIDPERLGSPADLGEYFDAVLKIDYTPVFSFRISDELPQEALPILQDSIKTIYAVGPENINHDVLGKVFHELIPVEVRKKIAAYYTMNRSADLLAALSITSENGKVLDPACGSGSILSSAYLRKKKLAPSFGEKEHRKYIEKELTGIDAMPFAAHMSVIHLALQAPIFDTDEVNVGIADSTKLRPGSKINPLSFVLPESDSQRGLSEYAEGERPDTSEEEIEAGSVAMDASIGREMELDTVDVVFMNPPFSRQESVAGFAENYKDRLRDRFARRDNAGQLHGKMNFSSYFLFLADEFLEVGGRIASVLPASVLTNSSDAGVREMLLNEYSIEYIITREDEPNFSEDTDRREILLVARKGTGKEVKGASFVTLETLNADPAEIQRVSDSISVGEDASGGGFRVRKASLAELDVHNMFAPMSVHDAGLLRVWDDVNDSDPVDQIQTMNTGLIRGGSSHPWQDGVICDPLSHLQKEDYWLAVEVSKEEITASHKHAEEVVTIPRSHVRPYFLRYSYRKKADVTDLDEYVIVNTQFDKYDKFAQLGGGDPIPSGWRDHVQDAASHATVQRRCDLTAVGTSHLAFYSGEPRTFHRMWCFSDLNEVEAKVFTAFLDSNIGLLQLIISRLPERGGWTNYRRFNVERFSTLNPAKLPQEDINAITKAFDEYAEMDAPSLASRTARLTSRDALTDAEYAQLKSAYGDDMADSLGKGFDELELLDNTLLNALGYEPAERSKLKNELYPRLLMELVELKAMMD